MKDKEKKINPKDMLFDDVENYDDDYVEEEVMDDMPEESEASDLDIEDEDMEGGTKTEQIQKARKKKNKIWLIALVLELITLGVLIYLFANSFIDKTFEKMTYTELVDTHVNEDIPEESVKKMKGYTNIALFGIDTRDIDMVDSGARSDSIIICSINNDTQEVKLVSIYRDTYMELCSDSVDCDKAAHAFAYDGPQGAINMLNKNLDLNISAYVAVNFKALTEAIDALGGLDIEVKSSELNKINQCIAEQIGVNGIEADYVNETGLVHLNGVQATAYARVRSTDQGDITRTWRQRLVIQKMVEKAKSAGPAKLMDAINVVVDDVSSSLTKKEILQLATDCFDYEIGTTTGFPFTYCCPMINERSFVVGRDMATNVTALHRFLFDDMDYAPSATVQRISDETVDKTGYGNTLDLDTFMVQDDVDSIMDTD